MRNIYILIILLLINLQAWSQKITVDTNIIFIGQQAEIKISNKKWLSYSKKYWNI